MKKIFGLIVLASLLLSNCEWLEENVPAELSEAEIIEGLKTALEVGTDSASNSLSTENGYYSNLILRIPLPEEAQVVREFVSNNVIADFFNLDQEFENVIISINKAAESAAKEAAPIFKEAILNLTIEQSWDILNGITPEGADKMKSTNFDSTAATAFLQIKTFDPLTSLYAPKINSALGKDLGLGFSATDAWETLTSNYNKTLNSTAVQAALLAAQWTGNSINIPGEMNTNLGEFSTQKALDGIFYKVGEEEKKIRKNPFEYVVDILEKVFGSILEQ